MRPQRRGQSIAMTSEEVDSFLDRERTCRGATISASGRLHVAPLWFVWDGDNLWLYSIVKSQRWTDITHNPQIAIVVDAGTEYLELQGVEIHGQAAVIGEVPRTSTTDPELEHPERLFALKYMGTDQFFADRRHAWLRVVPDKVTSWDFTKLTGG
ncbi:hypothetical protein ABIA30_004014 [Mycobacterium sp. MAA66]|uniref:pyridoxamine 5'-phosphate oxidase family protein n=1 Tax=Mycobacterium sp. MAA66 TaxID=3156297 RepID=UPI00351158E9